MKFAMVYSSGSDPELNTFPRYSQAVPKGGLAGGIVSLDHTLEASKSTQFLSSTLPVCIPKPADILSPIDMTALISCFANQLSMIIVKEMTVKTIFPHLRAQMPNVSLFYTIVPVK